MKLRITFDEGTSDTFRGKVAGRLALVRTVTLAHSDLILDNLSRHSMDEALRDVAQAFRAAESVVRS